MLPPKKVTLKGDKQAERTINELMGDLYSRALKFGKNTLGGTAPLIQVENFPSATPTPIITSQKAGLDGSNSYIKLVCTLIPNAYLYIWSLTRAGDPNIEEFHSSTNIVTIRNRLNGAAYVIQVKAIMQLGETPWSTQVGVSTTLTDAPCLPMGSFAPTVGTISGRAAFTVDWSGWQYYDDPSILYYNLYASSQNGFSPISADLIASNITHSPFTVNSLAVGATYYVIVQAVSINGQTSNSLQSVVVVPSNTNIPFSGSDPTNPGDIVIIPGTSAVLVGLDHCDAVTQWTYLYGVTLDKVIFEEGTGSAKIVIPPNTAFVAAICTKSSGSWDLSGSKYLKVWLRTTIPSGVDAANCYLYFGEATYNEQSYGPLNLTNGLWTQIIWDISGIAGASRDAVTKFAVIVPNASPLYTRTLHIDYVYADLAGTGSKVETFDGDNILTLYPQGDLIGYVAYAGWTHSGDTAFTDVTGTVIALANGTYVFEALIEGLGSVAYVSTFTVNYSAAPTSIRMDGWGIGGSAVTTVVGTVTSTTNQATMITFPAGANEFSGFIRGIIVTGGVGNLSLQGKISNALGTITVRGGTTLRVTKVA
jgi:hypothetical protein